MLIQRISNVFVKKTDGGKDGHLVDCRSSEESETAFITATQKWVTIHENANECMNCLVKAHETSNFMVHTKSKQFSPFPKSSRVSSDQSCRCWKLYRLCSQTVTEVEILKLLKAFLLWLKKRSLLPVQRLQTWICHKIKTVTWHEKETGGQQATWKVWLCYQKA